MSIKVKKVKKQQSIEDFITEDLLKNYVDTKRKYEELLNFVEELKEKIKNYMVEKDIKEIQKGEYVAILEKRENINLEEDIVKEILFKKGLTHLIKKEVVETIDEDGLEKAILNGAFSKEEILKMKKSKIIYALKVKHL